jgi:prophage regulatory protein
VLSELRLVGLAEIAELLGVSKRTASRYVARADFPPPVAELAMGPIWLTEDVEKWVSGTPVRRGRPPVRGSGG